MKKIIGIMLGVMLWLNMGQKVWAVSEFETSYESSYRVEISGKTKVVHKVALTNKLSNIYAQQFKLAVGLTDLSNIIVRDSVGRIEPVVKQEDNKTVIEFSFIDKVVGKGKTNNFEISYESGDIAVKNGSVWEINIPYLEGDNGLKENKVSLIVPSVFGLPSYIAPNPIQRSDFTATESKNNVYIFDLISTSKEAVSAVFGREQYMRFELYYHLKNSDSREGEMEVALPMDTNYQKVMIENIVPEPESVKVDEDGNWIARYNMLASEKKDIVVRGVVKLNFYPRQENLSDEKKIEYIKATEFWPSDNSQIKELADQLKTAGAIYDYVVDVLSYDYAKIDARAARKGGLAALAEPNSAICTDFTDLFITLARAAGIPAREIEGYAFADNDKLRPLSLSQDILHAWPEYYDETKQAWIEIDPTWGETTGGIDYFNKLDLNHFGFVRHGMNSTSPLPAGGYKLENQPSKDVSVYAIEPINFPDPKLNFNILKKTDGVYLEVENRGEIAASGLVNVEANLIEGGSGDFDVNYLPPWGNKEFELKLKRRLSLGSVKTKFNITYGKNRQIIEQEVASFSQKEIIVATGVGGGILVAVAFGAWRLYIRKRKKEPTLRW